MGEYSDYRDNITIENQLMTPTTQQQHQGLVSGPFEEHLGVIAALQENYIQDADDNDGRVIQAIHDMYDHMKDLCKQKEMAVRDVIQSLMDDEQALQKNAAYPRDVEEHPRRIVTLQEEKKRAETSVSSLEAQLNALEEERRGIQASLQEVEGRWNKLKEAEGQMNRQKNLVSLYLHVTKISWNLKRLGSGEEIAGTIDNPDAGILQDFHLPRGDDFDTVNDIWNMISSYVD
jgi:vacuolar-type H+-ATPase subunit I/STV1